MNRLFFFIGFLFLSFALPAQPGGQRPGGQAGQRQSGQRQSGDQAEVLISGYVKDSSDKSSLPGAHVSLMHFQDTTRVYRATTDDDGKYSIRVRRGRYYIGASYVGYQSIVLAEPFAANQAENLVGDLELTPGALLDEVQITGERPSVLVRGDTLDFDARAFKLNPDANAEDLVRRMAGISVQDGAVTAQGEEVRRVFVDGREFFGDDPSIALRNLPAEVIERIEVYDQMSDQAELTGFDDGERSKTINIVTRLDTRSGQFGRIYSGYGADERYQAGLVTNIFHNDARISILGMTNNINEQNFTREDFQSFVGGGRGGRGGFGGGPGGGMPMGDFRGGSRPGFNTTHALGLNLSNSWNDKLNVSGSYFMNISDNITNQFTDRQYFLDDVSSQLYRENSEESSRSNNHRFSMRANYDIDEKNTIRFTPRGSIQNNNSDSYFNAFNALGDNILVSQSETGYDSDLTGYNYSGSLLYRRQFGKTGRTASINLSANANNNQNLYFLDALNEYFSEGETDPANEDVVSDYLNQRSDSETINNTISSNISYTEPFGEKGMLQVGYNISRARRETDRMTHSWDDELDVYGLFEPGLSNRLQSNYLTQRGTIGYSYRQDRLNMTFEVGYQHAELNADQEFPYTSTINREFQNVLPGFRLNYNIARGKSLRFNYRTSTSAPSVNQLQDVVDNSNPMLLSSGNPNLNHSYSHFFMGRYNTTNTEKLTTFFAFIMGNFSSGYIGNSTIVARNDTILPGGLELNRGTQYSLPVNMDGFANLRSNLTYGFPLRFIKSNVNLSSRLSYMRTPSMINGQTNFANNYTMGGSLDLSSNVSRNVDFTLSYGANYNIVENTMRPQLDNTYYLQTTGVRFSFIFLEHWVWRSDISYLMYRGLGEDFNQDYALWNMNVGRKFLKNNLGELTLSVFDLLKQNDSIIRNVSGNYVEDLRTNALTRFFMLTFTYNLRNFNVREG
jgi:hypothetical protein